MAMPESCFSQVQASKLLEVQLSVFKGVLGMSKYGFCAELLSPEPLPPLALWVLSVGMMGLGGLMVLLAAVMSAVAVLVLFCKL